MSLKRICLAASAGFLLALIVPMTTSSAGDTDSPYQRPTWWQKAQFLLNTTSLPPCGQSSGNFSEGSNVDMSNEATPQSETSIAVNPSDSRQIVGGSNEIVCLPMRGYWSISSGASGTWNAVDLPLPPPLTTNGQDFGSDPGVAWDHKGNVYYAYIVVFFNRTFHAVQGSEMAVARSQDHGQSWTPTFFNLNAGNGKFNDKPMITVGPDNTVYVAWDNASPKNGKSSDNDVVLVSHSTDAGQTFSAPVQASRSQGGPAAVIGADPFVAPNGTLYVAWQDSINPSIQVAASTDGGNTFGAAHEIAPTLAVFQVLPPAQALRGALIYPACAATPARLFCSWSDSTGDAGMRVFLSSSADGTSWTSPAQVSAISEASDQFNQWLAVDPVTHKVVLSWNDSRNDPSRASTDIFFTETKDGVSFTNLTQVTSKPTNETCCGADPGNQYGDYEGIAAFGGKVHPVWTDRRTRVPDVLGLDEEVFTDTLNE